MTKSNAGFRPEEMNPRAFQRTAAITIDNQAKAITVTREFLADVSGRVDRAELALSNLEQRQRSFEQLSLLARLRWLLRGR